MSTVQSCEILTTRLLWYQHVGPSLVEVTVDACRSIAVDRHASQSVTRRASGL